MKWTLLQMTQDILTSAGSDEINSISDTTESRAVSNIIRQAYFNMLGRHDLPVHNQLFQLNPSNSSAQPVLMYKPTGVSRIEQLWYYDSNVLDGTGQNVSHGLNLDIVATNWSATSTTSVTIGTGTKVFTLNSSSLPITVNMGVDIASGPNLMIGSVISYVGTTLTVNVLFIVGSGTFSSWSITPDSGLNTPPGYLPIRALLIDDFINHVGRFNPTDTTVGSMLLNIPSAADESTPHNFTFYYKNDSQPKFYTILSNNYIIFDSYDSTQDSTLQASKSMGYGWVIPEFLMNDTFTPSLDEQQFPLLLNEAKALAFIELKEMPHPKAEKEAMRQTSSLQKFKSLANKPSQFDLLPSFGRRGRPMTGVASRTFR